MKFGEFVLKSGRHSPYFVNIGILASGEAICTLGEAYADMLHAQLPGGFDTVFGPAYKGIPLAVATCQALWRKYGVKTSYVCDRKERKDHGDGGMTFGAPLTPESKVVFVDDVISAGTSLRQSIHMLTKDFKCHIAAAIVAVDRQERGTKTLKSALPEIEQEFGMRIFSILKIRDVVEAIKGKSINGKVHINDRLYDDFQAYQRQYGSQ